MLKFFNFFFLQIGQVTRIVKHSGYSSANYNNDIALLQLDKILKFDNLLRPVCMPTPGKSFTGSDVNET